MASTAVTDVKGQHFFFLQLTLMRHKPEGMHTEYLQTLNLLMSVSCHVNEILCGNVKKKKGSDGLETL